jgi:hypothetical protein
VVTRVSTQILIESVPVARWGADGKEQKEERGILTWIAFPTRMQSPLPLTVDQAIDYEVAHLPD